MNNYVICSCNQDGSNLRFLCSDQGYWWSDRIKDALILNQQEALKVYDNIRNESNGKRVAYPTGMVSYDAPLTLRTAACICNSTPEKIIKIGVCSIELHSCADELWHVQDGMDKTYKIEENN